MLAAPMPTTRDTIARVAPVLRDKHGLYVRTRRALGLLQREVAAIVGRHQRTIARWEAGSAYIYEEDWRKLAVVAYPKDAELAATLAAAGNTTLEALGLVAPAPPARAPAAAPAHLVDSVVCAAAEAMNMPPQAVRSSVQAAFERAAALGLGLDDVRTTLRPTPKK